ncbi:hypothetical protein Ae201684_003711 [Aphanomyces euteiches]|uniref:Uncharacterized protein n=1 Tax=Aphanomyces euteiches TaxID=100861 RepID=A0A6G0XL51_9STRA|nr:hypothetical protein Ae201684_003711 [Aphanomyces euteiches]
MRFVRARKFLTDKLLWCHPSLAPFVCSIRPLVMKVGEKAISPIVDPTRSLFFSDLIPRDRNQQTRDLQEVVSRIEGILLNALTPLVGEHSRYSDHATSSHFVPAFVRVVDFMVVEALFEALCSSISHLSCSISGLPTDQQTLKSSFKCRSDDDCSEDLYTQIDALLARPFEHSGNITYKRLFQLQGAVRPPDPLFILKIAIHNTHITIIPEKELWLRKFRDMIADYISALDRVERISANSKIQDFVHKYCRPYFRHFFAESIQSFSTIVNNHVSIETMMKDLRTTLDIYFAEVEHLTSSCLPLKAEFLQIEKTTPPLSQGTLESVSYVTRIVQTHITLRRELQAADMMLLVGCFLVDRSIFVGEMLAKCNNKLLELYQELPKFCNHFFKRVVDDLAKKTAILVSIPECVEECTEWLACFCGLQSHTSSPVIHMGPCVSSLQQMVDSCRNDCPPELSSNLVNSFESGHLQWKIQNKALRVMLSRIEDNRSFYQELLSRINVHSSLARWVGQPLRPLAILPPDQFLLLKALFSAKGFSVDKNAKLVDCVLRTLYAASTSVVSQCRFRLLHNVVNTAYKITKEVNYVIHSHGKHGSHVKHDASPLNVARYKDTNVFRFALLLVLEPLGFVSSSQLHTVLDQFIPSNLTLTQENRTFASAFKVVLDRGHFAPEAKFIESGVALHHMLKSGTPTIVVGRTISAC